MVACLYDCPVVWEKILLNYFALTGKTFGILAISISCEKPFMKPGLQRIFRVISIIFILLCFLSGCAQNSGVEHTNVNESILPTSSTLQVVDTGWWKPVSGLSWQIQFDDELDYDLDVDVIDLDMDVDKSIVDQFQQQGTKVICYISAGSYEDWRTDAENFPDEILGKKYQGWPGEKWLDIRRIDLLAPIMQSRMDTCFEKGFNAVEFDNIDIYQDKSGFPLTYEDQLTYAVWLAEQAHARGLAAGQKNASEQVDDLVDVFDFAIIEDAFYYDWAEDMLPYIEAGKPVFAIEYTDLPGDFDEFCEQSELLGFSTILKNRNLDAWLETCQKGFVN